MEEAIDPKNKDLSYEELSLRYKANNEDSVLAEVFIRSFQLIIRLSKKYNLPEEDVCSNSLYIIHNSLIYYTPGKNKYFTYLCTALTNKCIYLCRKKYNSKNIIREKTIYTVVKEKEGDCDEFDIENFECELVVDPYDEADFLLTYGCLNLTPEEKVYINGIILGKTKKEIADELSVTSTILNCIKDNLAIKIYAAGVV